MANYDLLDIPPEQAQAITAELLRRRQQSAALQEANARANQFNPMAAAAQMANNPALAAAAQMAAKNAQAQHKPLSLGQMGYSIPSSGEFVPSPMYEDEKKAQRESTKELQQERLERQRERDRERMDFQRQRDEDRRSLALTLKAMGRSGGGGGSSKDAAAKPGKTLPAGEIRKLTEKEVVASSFGDLVSSFKDEFSGTPGLAKTQNILGKYNPLGMGKSYGDQSNWWQNYNDKKNLVRHALFGSALTKTEQAAFDSANITEGMDAKEIKRRLAQQDAAAKSAYNKLKTNFSRGGYNVDEFSDLSVPENVPKPGAAPSATAAPSWLPPGAKILGVREK